MRVEGRLWGAVAVAYAELGGAHEETLIQLERVADLISLAVSNADAREHLARMARTDPLTGLLNHGAFHERLDEEVRRSARHGRPLSLALLDIDHFKLVNDRHGHRAGDDALTDGRRASCGITPATATSSVGWAARSWPG